MIFRLFLILFFAAVLAVLQISAVPLLPFPLTTINLILTASFFAIFAGARMSLALWLALPAGFFLELYALTPFGLLFLSFLTTLVAANWFFHYFFTNRSSFSIFFFGLFSTLFFRFVFLVLNLLIMIKWPESVSISLREYGLITVGETFSNSATLFLIFWTAKTFTKRLKTVFLIK